MSRPETTKCGRGHSRVCKLAGLGKGPSHLLTMEGWQRHVPRGQSSMAPEAPAKQGFQPLLTLPRLGQLSLQLPDTSPCVSLKLTSIWGLYSHKDRDGGVLKASRDPRSSFSLALA